MNITVFENYETMSKKAAEILVESLKKTPDMTLGLATGSTPVGLYNNLIDAYNKSEISFKDVTTFNLDEYYPIAPENEQSYIYYMNANLFSKVDINPQNINIPNGRADNADLEALEYDKKIKEKGGIDLQLLGVGPNGHIAFNEPGEQLESATHVTELTQKTIMAKRKYMKCLKRVRLQQNALPHSYTCTRTAQCW